MDYSLKRIGKYKLKRLLNFGSVSLLFEGEDSGSGKAVAVKVFHAFSELPLDKQLEFRERFVREAKLVYDLNHPHIVSSLFWDEKDRETGLAYFVMELLKGDNIKTRLADGEKFDFERALGIIEQAAGALEYAHSLGIVHRDIKPANLHLSARGRLKITDFDIARIEHSSLTKPGQILGTPAYMSPEQIRGEGLDGRSDLFSLACVAYEMLSGVKAFQAGDSKRYTAIMSRVLTQDPIPPSEINSILPRHVDEVLLKSLSKSREDRFASATDFYNALSGRS